MSQHYYDKKKKKKVPTINIEVQVSPVNVPEKQEKVIVEEQKDELPPVEKQQELIENLRKKYHLA